VRGGGKKKGAKQTGGIPPGDSQPQHKTLEKRVGKTDVKINKKGKKQRKKGEERAL